MREQPAAPGGERAIPLGRRQALGFLGAGLAVGLAGCCCLRAPLGSTWATSVATPMGRPMIGRSAWAQLMTRANGDRMFGDLGYWSELRCVVVGSAQCEAAVRRLLSALSLPLANGEKVADRVMFGSDWLMRVVRHPKAICAGPCRQDLRSERAPVLSQARTHLSVPTNGQTGTACAHSRRTSGTA